MGISIAIRFFENYKGLQITFPVRLYDKEHIKEIIKKEYDGKNARALACKYSYSERWIRKIVSDSNKK